MPKKSSNSYISREKRILNDLREIQKDPVENIFVSLNNDNIDEWNILIIGPEDTPYAHGFFFFRMTYPQQYPLVPPKLILITTEYNITRFNPNLYSNGKVCLSIINTWSGPKWTSIMTSKSVLLSVQSLMCNEPLYNEPGFDTKPKSDSIKYNMIVEYQKYEVAIVKMLKNPHYPEFIGIMKDYLKKNYKKIHDRLKFFVINKQSLLNKYGKLDNKGIRYINLLYVNETTNVYLNYDVVFAAFKKINI